MRPATELFVRRALIHEFQDVVPIQREREEIASHTIGASLAAEMLLHNMSFLPFDVVGHEH